MLTRLEKASLFGSLYESMTTLLDMHVVCWCILDLSFWLSKYIKQNESNWITLTGETFKTTNLKVIIHLKEAANRFACIYSCVSLIAISRASRSGYNQQRLAESNFGCMHVPTPMENNRISMKQFNNNTSAHFLFSVCMQLDKLVFDILASHFFFYQCQGIPKVS